MERFISSVHEIESVFLDVTGITLIELARRRPIPMVPWYPKTSINHTERQCSGYKSSVLHQVSVGKQEA